MVPSKILNGHFQVFFKPDRIHDVPAIEPEPHHDLVIAAWAYHLVQSGIRRAELLVFSIPVKIVGSAEIIFRSCAADGGKFAVAIEVEFYFTLSPPAIVVDAPGKVESDKLPFPLDPIH